MANPSFFSKHKYIVLILFLALLLRLVFVTDYAAMIDEDQRIPFGLFPDLRHEMALKVDWAPPTIYYIIGSVLTLTDSIIFLRMLFILFGLLNILLVYLIAMEFGSEKFAAILAAVNIFSVLYAVQIGPYTLVGTIALLTVYIMIKLLIKKTVLSLILIGLLWGLGMSIHYYFLFLIIPQICIILLALYSFRKQVLLVLVPCLLALLVFAPHIPLFLYQLTRSTAHPYFAFSLLPYLAGVFLFYLPHGFSWGFMSLNPIALFLALSLFVISSYLLWAYISYFYTSKNKNDVYVAGTFFGFLLINAFVPLVGVGKISSRYLTVILPIYFILLSIGLKQISPFRRKLLLLLIILLSLLVLILAYTVFPFDGEVNL